MEQRSCGSNCQHVTSGRRCTR